MKQREPRMDLKSSTATVVFIDPKNDVLSERSAGWEAVGASVERPLSSR
jgi:hypothetical protein